MERKDEKAKVPSFFYSIHDSELQLPAFTDKMTWRFETRHIETRHFETEDDPGRS